MRVSLFVTCLGDRFFADAAADAVRLLRSLDVDVDFPKNQTCCGQPAWNSGHIPQAREMAAHTAAVFADSDYVVLPSGSCAAMLRCTYPRLLEAPVVAERSYELAEFLVDVLDEWWMVAVIPVVTVATFLLSHWVTTSVIEPAEG